MDALTVSTPVSERGVREDGVLDALNGEVLPALRQMRSFANTEVVQAIVGASPGNGVAMDLWTSDPIPTDVGWQVVADVIGHGGAEWVNYRVVGFFVNEGGVVAQVGATDTIWTFETSAGPNALLDLRGQGVALEVEDDGVTAFAWHAIIRVFATPRP